MSFYAPFCSFAIIVIISNIMNQQLCQHVVYRSCTNSFSCQAGNTLFSTIEGNLAIHFRFQIPDFSILLTVSMTHTYCFGWLSVLAICILRGKYILNPLISDGASSNHEHGRAVLGIFVQIQEDYGKIGAATMLAVCAKNHGCDCI